MRKLKPGGHQFLYGLGGSQRAMLLHHLVQQGNDVLFVASGVREAETVLADYEFFSGSKGQLYPARPVLVEGIEAESRDTDNQRLRVINQLTSSVPCLVATPVSAMLELLPPRSVFRKYRIPFSVGQPHDLSQLAETLSQLGYQSVDKVDAPGQFSRRGDIVDIFDSAGEHPWRIQFFDVEIESIREFDIESQRSKNPRQSVEVGPARMTPLPEGVLSRVLSNFDQAISKSGAFFRRQLEQDRERFANQGYWPGCQRYLPFMYSKPQSFLEYFSEGHVVTAETPDLLHNIELLSGELIERQKQLIETGKLLPSLQPYLSSADLVVRWQKQATVHTGMLMRSPGSFALTDISSMPFRQVPSFYGQQKLLVDEVKAWLQREVTIVIVGGSQQMAETLKQENIPVFLTDIGQLKKSSVNIVPGRLSAGFELLDQKLVVLSMAEIAGQSKQSTRPSAKKGMTAGDIQSLQPGEYVVHANHGIGQFIGTVTREIAGVKRDYLYIRYAGQDKLFLPTDQVQYLQRYLGGGDKPPKLYSLGGGDWQRVKTRVRESVQKMAFDLLQLYAKRENARGHGFAPDTPWQRELEEGFPYQETPDQLRAIEEVKKDMEDPRPMDRLLCGDVGYGKTEVALRAAMKAVMDERQVVILAPTTVLAQQHFRTFSERFAPFPVNVEVLSRFRSAARQKEIVRQLAAGNIDIVIGTHRLLQRDVELPRLGLVVVDEEQRFGVEHKESLKNLRANIDILSMTATPIPRTLQMALMGIRDLSIIDTPPEGRYPVQTYVVEYSDDTVVYAISRELDRGGQVYVIFNRVQGIDATASRLRRLLPDASIAVIHGQMAESQIERTMLEFHEGDHQVLLSTTIVENGLDIPNVNTAFIFDADRLGLSQLYQLRGRVGRGRRLAYAYFTYRPQRVLTEKAQKRLMAIKEFTQLGSGYKLSLKDLEIRGAGNILGPEQHGYIAAVGYDLYCKLLKEQIDLLSGQSVEEQSQPAEVSINLPVDAYAPDSYLPEQEKFYLYRRLRNAKSLTEADDIEDELRDRFGPPPKPLQNLLDVARIKVLASQAGIEDIDYAKDKLTGQIVLTLSFVSGREPESTLLQRLWSLYNRQFDFRLRERASVTWKLEGNVIEELEKLLHQLQSQQD